MSKGMTFIELLICLSIISIIFCFNTPLSSLLYQTNQLQVVANEIKSAIQYAKIQAINRHEQIILAPLPLTHDWSTGIAVLANGQILQTWPWQIHGLSVVWHGFQSHDYLLCTYDVNRSSMNGFFLLSANNQQIKLVINRLGRVK